MFKKILVANRGEIALRIICACKELRIPSVAVYSEPDRDSLHVRFADQAVCIGPAPSLESYLNVPSIISAAEITDVEAIHPGYGYLAESSDFAEVCETCGITFIGPHADSIALMGNKAKARETMARAGLPIIPGTGIVGDSAEEMREAAASVGFPLIVKASAGGGGRGMRIVEKPEQVEEAIANAQAEAGNTFGNDDIYLERYLERPRHIEFQVIADQTGAVLHLGERECSIQRRHQKLLEESPSPLVKPEMREALGQLISQAVSSINYLNAGTVEFLYDDQGDYFFLEMNTRIQVEHPVTEKVTGIDLVKEQIRIAAGETLSIQQQDIRLRGHSIECRINAESPYTLKPSPGQITAYHPPGGPGVRVDSMAYAGMTVSPYYDSLIAKLIAYGADRAEAIRRMERALDMFMIEGIETTIPLHKKILQDPDFQAGLLSTEFLGSLEFDEAEEGL